MSKHIIVAGAGHGGLTAAAYLAKAGYQVDLYERNKREDLGYDWHDTMNNRTFEYAGITEINKKDLHNRKDSTFYAPSLRTQISFDVPVGKVDVEIERKVLYNYLINNAVDKGVKIHYETKIKAPLIDKTGDVIGLIVDDKEIRADMVIDSAGMHSAIRNNLPESYNINKAYKGNQIFYTYRAYYNLIEGAEITNKDRFNIYFKFNDIKGIAWYKITNGMADVLVGRITPITLEEVSAVLSELRKVQPSIGNELLRGGQIKEIPIRSTFSLMVGNNYAAVGDSASMPLPLNGSGITNSILGGKLLAETIIDLDNNNLSYKIDNLWKYQVKYYLEVADKMISIALLKNQLLNYSGKIIDFLFDSGVLSSVELSAGATGKEISLGRAETLDKLKRGYKRPISLIKLKITVGKSKKARALARNIPAVYDKALVDKWIKEIDSYLK